MTEVKVSCISNKSKLIFKNVKNTKYIQHKVYLQHHLSNLEVFQVDFEDGTPILAPYNLDTQKCATKSKPDFI